MSFFRPSISDKDRSHARTLRVCSQILRGSAVVSSALALVGLLGWWTDSTLLAGLSPRFPRLGGNTSLALLLASASLLLLERPDGGKNARWAGRIAAFVVFVIGAVTVLEYSAGVDLGIDRLLLPAGACDGDVLCGRPSLNAGFVLVLYATALLVLDVETVRGRRPAQLLAATVAFSSLAALAGYVYGAPPLYHWPHRLPSTGLSVHATLALSFLSIGLFCARPQRGVMTILTSRYAGGAVARRFLVPVLLSPLIGLVWMAGVGFDIYSAALASALIAVTAAGLSIAWVLRSARRLDDADRALQSAARRYRTFVEHAADPIFIADVTGQLVDVNHAACDLLGYRRDELLALAVSDIVPPDQQTFLAETRLELLKGHEHRGEWVLVAKDGTEIPVDGSTVITQDGQWQATARDIRERKAAEHRFTATSDATLAFARALAEIPARGFEGVIRAVADEARLVTDAESAAIEIAAEPSLARPATTITVGSHGDVVKEIASKIRIADREIGCLRITRGMAAGPFGADAGSVLEAIAPRAALAIESASSYAREVEGRARLQALLDSMPAGILFVDANGVVRTKNAFLDAFRCEGFTRDDHPVQRALRTRMRVAERMPLQRKDGTYVTMQVTAAPVVTSSDETVRGAVATFHDISAIEELERLRDEWNTIVAHELRQPLNAIGLAVQALERDPSIGDLGRKDAGAIRGEARRLDRMISDLSDASRISAHRLKLATRPTAIVPLVRDLVARMRGDVRVTVRGAGRDSVMIDPLRIEQVLRNLLSNAEKYRVRETPIDVDIEWRDDAVVVSVSNQNVAAAMSAADGERIFDRFTRLESARDRSGLGIGLYIARGLVQAHGGALDVTSADGVTTFRVTLPLTEVERAPSGIHVKAG